MWRIKLSFLFVCVYGKSLQKILIYTSYEVVVIEFLRVYLVYLIHYAFQNSRFKGCFRIIAKFICTDCKIQMCIFS